MTRFAPTVAAKLPRRRRSAGLVLGLAAALGAIGTCAAHYASGSIGHAPLATGVQGGDERAASAGASKPAMRVAEAGDAWPKSFFDSLFASSRSSVPRPARPPAMKTDRRQGKPRSSHPRSSRHSAPRQHDVRYGARFDGRATYRTMCVRLCDGYYWPIGFASPPSNFDRDSKTCQQSCNSPAALYYYPNPGGEPEDMADLEGRPYASLSSAFLHRSSYNASCKCRPHPWETEALERHERYAHQPPSRTGAEPRR